MNFSSLLSNEQIILEMRSTGHNEAIEELVDRLESNGLLDDVSTEEVLEGLLAREDQTSTGIGSGVAIPHVFTDKVDHVVAVFGRSKEGVDFEALDHAPVKSIFLLILPESSRCRHLQTLAGISKLFHKAEVRAQLCAAETKEDILAVLHTPEPDEKKEQAS